MTCCTHGRRALAPHDDGRIVGTWDFKWPQGAKVRVAFQELPPEQMRDLDGFKFTGPDAFEPTAQEAQTLEDARGFQLVTRAVECLARRWLTPLNNQAPGIYFAFDHSKAIRSAEESEVAQAPADDYYDVLVSLANLPAFQNRAGLEGETKREKVFLPSSELGRYAQRIDYGVPTTYLGKREFYSGSMIDYLNSREFQHWVIHEFGHVLGLPHEQQNPRLRIKLKPKDEVVEILSGALGYPELAASDVTGREVSEEIFEPWPVKTGPDGTPLYSDFRKYPAGVVGDDRSSVMFHVFWQRILEGGSPDAPPVFHIKPTDNDREHLSKMYPPAPPLATSAPRAANEKS